MVVVVSSGRVVLAVVEVDGTGATDVVFEADDVVELGITVTVAVVVNGAVTVPWDSVVVMTDVRTVDSVMVVGMDSVKFAVGSSTVVEVALVDPFVAVETAVVIFAVTGSVAFTPAVAVAVALGAREVALAAPDDPSSQVMFKVGAAAWKAIAPF